MEIGPYIACAPSMVSEDIDPVESVKEPLAFQIYPSRSLAFSRFLPALPLLPLARAPSSPNISSFRSAKHLPRPGAAFIYETIFYFPFSSSGYILNAYRLLWNRFPFLWDIIFVLDSFFKESLGVSSTARLLHRAIKNELIPFFSIF